MADRKDPYRNFRFRLEIDGVTKAGFTEVSGLEIDTDVVEYREGKDPIHKRKLPGLVKYTDITLKKGLTDSPELWDWYKKVVNGQTERTSGAIILLDEEGTDAVRWNFVEGWPSKWTGPDMKADGSAVAIETLVIKHEGLDLG
jgi:phage tail-like protein